jgi:predicted transcriptional regulator
LHSHLTYKRDLDLKIVTNLESIFDEAEQIFIELSNSQRLQIIHTLHRQEMNLAGLSKHLAVTMQEVHRNLNRLMEAGLIEKKSTGVFSLTTFGNIIIRQIPSIDFLSKNKAYFSNHTLGDMPMKFIQRIGALNGGELIVGWVAVVERLKLMYRQSHDYIYGMLPQVTHDLIEAVIPMIREHGIKFKYILPENAQVPKAGMNLLKEISYDDLLEKGLIERKMNKKITVAVVLNERESIVMFPSTGGETDMNEMFFSNISSDASIFHEWSHDYFFYNWYNSHSFNSDKLEIV